MDSNISVMMRFQCIDNEVPVYSIEKGKEIERGVSENDFAVAITNSNFETYTNGLQKPETGERSN